MLLASKDDQNETLINDLRMFGTLNKSCIIGETSNFTLLHIVELKMM